MFANTIAICRRSTGNRRPIGQRWMMKRTYLELIVAPLMALALLSSSASATTLAPPANDNFNNAIAIDASALPFSNIVDITEATNESGEGFYCTYSYQTIWYKITPTAAVWLSANTIGSGVFSSSVSVYRDNGSGIFGLSYLSCAYNGTVTFLAQAGTTYYFQAMAPCCGYAGTVRLNVAQTTPPVPVASFYYYPGDPSVYDTINFQDQSSDPGQAGIQSWAWDFGDGATATGCCPTHRYAADGDYSVTLTVTTTDGRSADTTRVLRVQTHDVAITRFRTPESASVGQTRQISIGINSNRNAEIVRVELAKSVPGYYEGFQTFGYLEQYVPQRSSNRTVDFDFSYTFSNDDALIGKVSFRAVATILSARDVLPADNEAISFPTKVGRITKLSPQIDAGSEAASEARFELLGVTPNPAHAGVDMLVRLSLPEDGNATLQVLDLAGRVMTERDLGSLGPGVHEVRMPWERSPAPGNYWVRLTQGGRSISTRVSILH